MALFGFVIYYFDKVRLERDDVFNHADNNVIQGELHRPRLPLLLQAQCLRGLQRTRHCDAPGRPPCPGHLLLAQDRGHQEEEEKQYYDETDILSGDIEDMFGCHSKDGGGDGGEVGTGAG